jgi:hypothetical protein
MRNTRASTSKFRSNNCEQKWQANTPMWPGDEHDDNRRYGGIYIGLDVIAYIEKCIKDREFGRKVRIEVLQQKICLTPFPNRRLERTLWSINWRCKDFSFRRCKATLRYLAKRKRGQILITAISHVMMTPSNRWWPKKAGYITAVIGSSHIYAMVDERWKNDF